MQTQRDSDDVYSWRFFRHPHDTWEAMYRDCINAEDSIEFEQYILENDKIGQSFMELFIEKAKEGIKVFIVCDMFGSTLLARSPLVKELKKHGGFIYFYNSFGGACIFMPWKWFPRTHTKTLLIDSSIAYTGGVCMAERMRYWRDTHVRITGPVTKQIRQVFDDMESRILKKQPLGVPKPSEDLRFRYIVTSPIHNHFAIYKELKRAVKEAKHYIYISSAFFVPNPSFVRLLKSASKRSVDVRVIVPERSDVLLADWLCLSYTRRFLDSGIRIFHYQKTVLHSKTVIIDDSWGTIGSTNLDILSFFHNREANIITTDPEAVLALKNHFIADLKYCAQLTHEIWQKIPIWKKAAGYAVRMIKIFV